jgi:Phytanoyl-CoA dioxygenase (PhyH)
MTTTLLSPAVRLVTAGERDFYRENGWVHLKRLIDPGYAAEIHERVRRQMGADGAGAPRRRAKAAFFRTFVDPAADDPTIAALGYSNELGSAAAHLLGRPVRRWNNIILVKNPDPAPFSAATPWHQDLPSLPHDRVGRPNVWIALNDIPPERASLRFLSGSHRLGPIGRFQETDALDYYPELATRYPMGPALHLEPGDATVHEAPTVHGTAANTSGEARYVYCVTYVRADARFTGGQSNVTDGLGLPVWQPFEHEKFPLVEALPESWS